MAAQEQLAHSRSFRHWDAIPPRAMVGPDDVLVIDLTETGEHPDPSALRSLPERLGLYVVIGDKLIDPAWLIEIVQRRTPTVTVLERSARGRSKGFRPLLSRLMAKLAGPSVASLARLVLDRERLLEPVSSLVVAICTDPWVVRRPKDLGVAAGITLSRLRASCRSLGFVRVEHFIIAVRMVAAEVLVTERRLSPSAARRLVGISSATNARRQIQRARRRSFLAFRRLRYLITSWLVFILGLALS